MVNPYSFYSNYCPEYRAVIMRAISLGYRLPSIPQQILQDTLMRSFVSSGVLTKADLLYILANDAGLDFARINWKDPSSNLLTNVGTVYYLKNYGPYVSTSEPGDDDYSALDTGWAPIDGVNFTQDSNSILHGVNSGFTSTGFPWGVLQNTAYYSINATRYAWNNNTTALNTSGASFDFGFFLLARTGSSTSALYIVGESALTTAFTSVIASTTRSSSNLHLLNTDISSTLAYNISSIALGAPLDSFFIGAALTSTEAIDCRNAINTYNNSIRHVFAASVNGNYTVPAGVTEILVECWGGGGAGRGYPNSGQSTTGAGGGGGAYSASIISVTPGDVIPYVIGAGGVGGTANGGDGGDTSWNSGEVLAKGGIGGHTTASGSGQGGLGGQASGGTGQIKYSGGKGGNEGTQLNASSGSGGSGASSIGDGPDGLNGTNAGAGARPPYNMLGPGAPGSKLSNAENSNGKDGTGSSGGSGARRTSSARNGGNGGSGFIRVSAAKQY